MYGNYWGQYVDTAPDMCLEGCSEQNADCFKNLI